MNTPFPDVLLNRMLRHLDKSIGEFLEGACLRGRDGKPIIKNLPVGIKRVLKEWKRQRNALSWALESGRVSNNTLQVISDRATEVANTGFSLLQSEAVNDSLETAGAQTLNEAIKLLKAARDMRTYLDQATGNPMRGA